VAGAQLSPLSDLPDVSDVADVVTELAPRRVRHQLEEVTAADVHQGH